MHVTPEELPAGKVGAFPLTLRVVLAAFLAFLLLDSIYRRDWLIALFSGAAFAWTVSDIYLAIRGFPYYAPRKWLRDSMNAAERELPPSGSLRSQCSFREGLGIHAGYVQLTDDKLILSGPPRRTMIFRPIRNEVREYPLDEIERIEETKVPSSFVVWTQRGAVRFHTQHATEWRKVFDSHPRLGPKFTSPWT